MFTVALSLTPVLLHVAFRRGAAFARANRGISEGGGGAAPYLAYPPAAIVCSGDIGPMSVSLVPR